MGAKTVKICCRENIFFFKFSQWKFIIYWNKGKTKLSMEILNEYNQDLKVFFPSKNRNKRQTTALPVQIEVKAQLKQWLLSKESNFVLGKADR